MQGGTQMWCPRCKTITVCAAKNLSSLGYRDGQRWYHTEHTDIQWLRRGRQCQSCYGHWLTSEVNEDFLDELVELRDALATLKANAEEYAAESSRAAESLARLTDSLQVLRALDIYKRQAS